MNPVIYKRLMISQGSFDQSYFLKIMNATTITYDETTKILGVILNRSLSWTDHIDGNVVKCYKVLRILWCTFCASQVWHDFGMDTSPSNIVV